MTLVPEGTANPGAREVGAHSVDPLIVFLVEKRRYAVDLRAVERVVHALAVKEVPGAPDFLLGLVRIGGAVVPVVDTRACLGHRTRDVRFGDQLLVLGRGERSAALVVDHVIGIVDPVVRDLPVRDPDEGEDLLGFVRSGFDLEGAPVTVCDLDRFFAAAEAGWAAAPDRGDHS